MVEALFEEVADPTQIPPIFLIRPRTRFQTADGSHRVHVARTSKSQPYLLAYVKKEDLAQLDDAGIVYKRVEAV